MSRIVIELTRTSIRLLRAEGQGRSLRLAQLVVESLLPEQEREQQCARLIKQVKTANRPTVILAMPRDQIMTRLLKLPTTRADELAQMLEFSGKAQLPYSPEHVLADFHLVKQEGGMSTVQLVACHREIAERQVELWQRAGLEPAVLTPSSWGLLNWAQWHGHGPAVGEPVMVVNVDADHTQLAVVEQGRLIFSRSLSPGAQEWQTMSEGMSVLAQEIERSLASFRKELPAGDPQTFILTGLGDLESWRRGLEQRVTKPVVVRSAAGTLSLPGSAPGGAASLAAMIGLALADPSTLVSLLPGEAKRLQHHRRQFRQLTLTCALFLTAVFFGIVLLAVRVRREEQRAQSLRKALHALEAVTGQGERQERDATRINAVVTSRRWMASMLQELFRVTPSEILFENLVFDRARGELVIRGTAPGTREVLAYLHHLEQSKSWTKVELRFSARHNASIEARTDFELVLSRGVAS